MKKVLTLFVFLMIVNVLSAQVPYHGGTDDGYAMSEILLPVGIEANSGASEVLVFPTTVRPGEVLQIEAKTDRGYANLRLVSSDGKVVLCQGVSLSDGHARLVLPKLAKGIYLVEIYLEEVPFCKRIIIR